MTFEIEPLNPETYRRQTRRATLIIAVLFLALAMLSSQLLVLGFGESGGDNFRWNVAGVALGLGLSVALVRLRFWSQAWLAPSIYGWRLKRSLMRITNLMHRLDAGVAAGDPAAMKLLRFYHLGLTQMHQLDGNSSDLSQAQAEIELHRQRMEEVGLDPEQTRLDPAWLDAVRRGFAA
ncbi:DUF3087 domain-containing protein [Pseudomonas sp.]|uniref:DUF3087 domain-containing protein n=1 Tax=Pseudomonas sp. TaxID=306 RepID=UPI0028AC85D0|nr:DUF3087 domain-containing protein [Pseudomonas sp.]